MKDRSRKMGKKIQVNLVLVFFLVVVVIIQNWTPFFGSLDFSISYGKF